MFAFELTRVSGLNGALEGRDAGDGQRTLRGAVVGDRTRNHLALTALVSRKYCLPLPGALHRLPPPVVKKTRFRSPGAKLEIRLASSTVVGGVGPPARKKAIARFGGRRGANPRGRA